MVNTPRRDPVQADETEAAERFFRAHDRSHSGFIAESILQSQHCRFGAGQRREESGQEVVGGGLEADQDEIGGADFFRGARAFRLNVEISRGAFDPHAALAHNVKIGTEKEMHPAPGPAEQGAVITSQRAATDNGNFHSALTGGAAGFPSPFPPFPVASFLRVFILVVCNTAGCIRSEIKQEVTERTGKNASW
jgi:hypothetical protein